MKLIIYGILGGIAAFTIGAYFINPDYIFPSYAVESVLIDKTNTGAPLIMDRDVLSPLHLDEQNVKGVKLRVLTISNVSYNHTTEMSLPWQPPVLVNPYERNRWAAQFTALAQQVVDSVNRLPIGLDESDIYQAVISEANIISKLEGKEKTLIIYSDLHENSALYSVYNKKSREFLVTHLTEVEQLFKKRAIPRNLHGLRVYIIYKPRNPDENEVFTLMASLYKSILEEYGASVTIEANFLIP
jgi:hypothetical protein